MTLKHPNRIQRFLLLMLSVWFFNVVNGQEAQYKLEWQVNKNVAPDPEIDAKQLLKPFVFSNAGEDFESDYIIPFFTKKISIDGQTVTNVGISNTTVENHGKHNLTTILENDFQTSIVYSYEAGKKFALIKLVPIRKNGVNVEVLTSFNLDISTASAPQTASLKKKKDQTYNSALNSDLIYKVSVVGNGAYKIDAAFLSNNGIDVNSIELDKFKVLGNGGIMLPEIIATPRPEDVQENPLWVNDVNGNNKLDPEDFIIWYSPGHDEVKYNTSANPPRYEFTSHDFDEKAYYFIKWDGDPGLRISQSSANGGLTPTKTIEDYEHIITHEIDEFNHIESGRRWWGDPFQYNTSKTFSYSLSGLIPGKDMTLLAVTGARSLNTTAMKISVPGNPDRIQNYGTVSGDYDGPFMAGVQSTSATFTTPNSPVNLTFDYIKNLTESAAWIDYFVLAIPRILQGFDNQQTIRSSASASVGIHQFRIANFSGYTIFDVSDHLNPKAQATISDGEEYFNFNNLTGEQPVFHLFKSNEVGNPIFEGQIPKQNLHGLTGIEYFIITNPELKNEADELAQFHNDNSGLNTMVVLVQDIYNEFSSGSQDVTGIRDFLKLMYDRGIDQGTTLKYVCLFGDASYDYKDVIDANTNEVPIYQSYNSYLPASSYCSDDYYAILDDSEGYWGINSQDEGLDIGVGRLPASNPDEARIIVDKIKHYHSPASFGDWIQRLSFIGDDEDNNAHIGPSETMTDSIYKQYPEYNINKIWLDAYEQVSFGSGNKYPDVNSDINKAIDNQGTLIFNYVGHGGENGMAHERIITRPQMSGWTNYDKLSFYVTASCELARIDKVGLESPGELMLLNPNGGAIGMVATTRLVYIGANTDLNTEIIDKNIFEVDDGKLQTLGNTYMNTRNAAIEQVNKRTFMLIADPAMSLLSAPNKVVTTSINGKPAVGFSDTLKALSLVTIEGEIHDINNTLLSNFNGTLYPTLYDKFATYQTRGNDAASIPIQFELQNSVVYKGKVTVSDGKFSFQFVVPKDIAYNIGEGKMSYYADDGIRHAAGSDATVLIGGTSDELVDDQTPPEVELFIDDISWVFGGNTDNTPLLLAHISDSNGLNTVGSGIGREMEAILDKGTEHEESIILNDFYTPDVNTYRSGKIEYPFAFVSDGRHTLHLKVWDAYNNSAEAYTEFVVQSDEDIVLNHVLNYPNPFSTYTEFHFDHNKAGQTLTVGLTIMTAAGNVVKNLTQDILNAPTHSSDIVWDGKDQYGDKLARGVYIYTLKVKAEDGSTANQTQKLFIVN